jgi:hypothetical protein
MDGPQSHELINSLPLDFPLEASQVQVGGTFYALPHLCPGG